MKKKTPKKPTVEQILRTEIANLKEEVRLKENYLQKINTRSQESKDKIATLFNFVRFSVKDNEQASRKMYDSLNEVSAYRMKSVDDLSVEEMVNAIMQAFLIISSDYAREDEGTLLMQEHKNDLMQIIGTLIEDETRPNYALERLLGARHNLKIAEKDGMRVDINTNNMDRNIDHRR